MACCKCCCGGVDCAEGDQGKCCCGGSSGTCCQAGEYCCSGVCQSTPCDNPCGATSLVCEDFGGGEYLWSGTCTGSCDPYCKPSGATVGPYSSTWYGTFGGYECNAGNNGVVVEGVVCVCETNPLP